LSTIFDVLLHHEFWGDMSAAENAAYKEAANTGGAVVRVETVDIQARQVSFIGSIPEFAIDGEVASESRSNLLGSFHTTWGAVMTPGSQLGFLVVRHPLNLESYTPGASDLRRIVVTLDRTFNTIQPTVLGPVCCRKCKQPISPQRLRARPGTHLCTACQASNEEIFNGN